MDAEVNKNFAGHYNPVSYDNLPIETSPGDKVICTYEYSGESDSELSVRAGEILQIIELAGQWLLVQSIESQKEGFVPRSFVTLYDENKEIQINSIVIAIDHFEAMAAQELSVSEGEKLCVLNIEEGWCLAESMEREVSPGLVPLSYLLLIGSKEDRTHNFSVAPSSHKKVNPNAKGGLSFTYVITEPPGPPKRMFYDEIFDLLEKQKILSSITEKEKDFQQASYEIYVTEIDYVKDLRVMIDVFYQPLIIEKIVSEETVYGIFTEFLPNILGVHEILLKNLEKLRSKGLMEIGISTAFEKLVSIFQNYGHYFVNHASAVKLLTRKKENRAFANFVKNAEANPACKNLNLQSYLIKPIQRLTKYPLLLKELVNHCEDKEESTRLEKVINRLKSIVLQLNEEQRMTENREQILEVISRFFDKGEKKELMEKLSPKPDFLHKDSQFQRQGKGIAYINGKQNGDVHLFLFHDYLLCARKKVVNVMKSIRGRIPLKIFFLWPLSEISIRRSSKKGVEYFDVRRNSDLTILASFNVGDDFSFWMLKFEELGVLSDEKGENEGENEAENEVGDTTEETILEKVEEVPSLDPHVEDPHSSRETDPEEAKMLEERMNYRNSVISTYHHNQEKGIFENYPMNDDEDEDVDILPEINIETMKETTQTENVEEKKTIEEEKTGDEAEETPGKEKKKKKSEKKKNSEDHNDHGHENGSGSKRKSRVGSKNRSNHNSMYKSSVEDLKGDSLSIPTTSSEENVSLHRKSEYQEFTLDDLQFQIFSTTKNIEETMDQKFAQLESKFLAQEKVILDQLEQERAKNVNLEITLTKAQEFMSKLSDIIGKEKEKTKELQSDLEKEKKTVSNLMERVRVLESHNRHMENGNAIEEGQSHREPRESRENRENKDNKDKVLKDEIQEGKVKNLTSKLNNEPESEVKNPRLARRKTWNSGRTGNRPFQSPVPQMPSHPSADNLTPYLKDLSLNSPTQSNPNSTVTSPEPINDSKGSPRRIDLVTKFGPFKTFRKSVITPNFSYESNDFDQSPRKSRNFDID